MTANDAELEAGTGNDSFVDRELIPLFLVAGLVSLLFPEPVTSALGVVLVSVGRGPWLRDRLR